jgi:short subunit dehydrogenase-like uncharacterized protein
VVFGASGFVGRLVCEYIAKRSVEEKVSFAIAGRNQDVLEATSEALRTRFGNTVPFIVSTSEQPDAMVSSCRVLISCVGPFHKRGNKLVEACVVHGTHYIDSTGEPPFVRDCIDLFHTDAVANGVKVVNCCGFDSIPADLGTLYVLDEMRSKLGPIQFDRVDAYVEMRGLVTLFVAVANFDNVSILLL